MSVSQDHCSAVSAKMMQLSLSALRGWLIVWSSSCHERQFITSFQSFRLWRKQIHRPSSSVLLPWYEKLDITSDLSMNWQHPTSLISSWFELVWNRYFCRVFQFHVHHDAFKFPEFWPPFELVLFRSWRTIMVCWWWRPVTCQMSLILQSTDDHFCTERYMLTWRLSKESAAAA